MCVKKQHLGCHMQQEMIDIIAICNTPLYFHMRSASKPKNSEEQYATEDSETNFQVKAKMKYLKAERSPNSHFLTQIDITVTCNKGRTWNLRCASKLEYLDSDMQQKIEVKYQRQDESRATKSRVLLLIVSHKHFFLTHIMVPICNKWLNAHSATCIKNQHLGWDVQQVDLRCASKDRCNVQQNNSVCRYGRRCAS